MKFQTENKEDKAQKAHDLIDSLLSRLDSEEEQRSKAVRQKELEETKRRVRAMTFRTLPDWFWGLFPGDSWGCTDAA